MALLGQATFLTAFAFDHPGPAIIAHLDQHHSRAAYAKWLADPAYALWVLETPLKAVVGYAMLSPPELDVPTGEGDIELKRIYVLTGFQRGGHGKQLLDAVTEEARARGGRRLLLCVYTINHKARAFYRAQGFDQVGMQCFMVADIKFDDIIMGRAI